MSERTYVSYDSGCGKIACVSEAEASFLHEKIFVEEEYGHLDYDCGKHIVDVGGNIGVFSKYAALRSGANTTVWSFEPMPPLFECLRANVRACDKVYNVGTVPNIFVGGKSIGGGSETTALYDSGKLVPMMKEAGCIFS